MKRSSTREVARCSELLCLLALPNPCLPRSDTFSLNHHNSSAPNNLFDGIHRVGGVLETLWTQTMATRPKTRSAGAFMVNNQLPVTGSRQKKPPTKRRRALVRRSSQATRAGITTRSGRVLGGKPGVPTSNGSSALTLSRPISQDGDHVAARTRSKRHTAAPVRRLFSDSDRRDEATAGATRKSSEVLRHKQPTATGRAGGASSANALPARTDGPPTSLPVAPIPACECRSFSEKGTTFILNEGASQGAPV